MTNKIVECKDRIAFHPGQYVEELIKDYNVTQKEFAERLGVSAKTVNKLVNAEESISKETAHKLAKLSGVSMQTWLNLQNAYDVKVAEIVLGDLLRKEDHDTQLQNYRRNIESCVEDL